MFSRIRMQNGWCIGSTVSPAEFEAIDAMRPKAIDGDGGGTYAPTATLTIGGLATTLSATTLTLSATAMAVSAPGTWTAVQSFGEALNLTATQPAKTADPGANNRLYSTNTVKAWAKISTDGVGGYTIDDGYNVASCTLNAAYVEVTWARVFANANYAPVVTASIPFVPNAVAVNVNFPNQTTSKTRLYFYDIVGAAALNPLTNGLLFSILVPGRQ